MDEKERHRLKQELRRGLSELRNRFDELHKDLEWAEMTECYQMTECYPKASAVYRMIERLEEIIRKI